MKRNMKNRKMTSGEKKKAKEIKHQQKEVLKLKKKINTTLNWLDIDEVQDNRIVLKRDKKVAYVQGFKVKPHNIFIDSNETLLQRLQAIRRCFNQTPENLFFAFVASPINADDYYNEINYLQMKEEDKIIHNMLNSDLKKMDLFQANFKELEFFIMIKRKNLQILEKDMEDLRTSLVTGMFDPQLLNKRDFYNYIAYAFENTTINDYIFARGTFTSLNRSLEYNSENDKYEVVDNTEDFLSYGTPIYNVPIVNKNIIKSKLAPTAIGIKNDYMIVGDKYVANLLVEKFTTQFTEGFLCNFLNIQNIKLFILDKHLAGISMATMLKRDLAAMKERYSKTADRLELSRIQQALDSQEEYIQQIIKSNDTTHDVLFVFQIWADDLKELKQKRLDTMNKLDMYGLSLMKGMFLQEQLFKVISPLWIDDYNKLPSVIYEQLGQPMPSTTFAGLYPFVFDTLKDKKGYLFGYERQNNGIIIFDPAFYINDPKNAVEENRINGNMIAVGKAGSGKTTAMNLAIRHFIKMKWKLIWVDPENKNEKITKKYNGTFVNWGQRNNILNIFDLQPISTDEDEDDSKKWDTELAIFNVIEDINLVFSYLFEGVQQNTLALIGDLVKKTYASVGIKKDKKGIYPSFKDLKLEDMPTFIDFNNILQKEIRTLTKNNDAKKELEYLLDLSIKVKRLLNEWSIYFTGHTTVKLPKENERQIISFGTKKLFNLSENLQTALYYVMFRYAWSLCLDDSKKSAFVIDEAHTMILKGKIASMVAQFYRRSRKYKNIMCCITQTPRDFADPKVLTDGKAIFQNAVYKMYMNLDKDGIEDLAKLETLNENEQFLLQDFHQGEGLFVCGKKRIPMQVFASQEELEEMGAGYDN